MLKVNLCVTNEEGLHSRPAMLFAKEAAKFHSRITIEKDGESFDAKSMLMVLSACICQNDQFDLTADGTDEESAINALSALVSSF